ncbi:MAG: sulfotransferase [Thermoguttaceae bacterium]
MKIDFVVPGYSKCGTTTLCALLAEHPGVFISKVKEPGFFAHEYDRGWDWYKAFFEDARDDQLHGEGSTFYSSDEYAELSCTRILERFPATRFIFMVRNPIKRIESSYRELHHIGQLFGVSAPFSLPETLKAFPNMLNDTLYWTQLCKYRRHVPDKRILIMFLEDFEKDPAAELQRCFRFLGLDPSVPISNVGRKLNTASAKLYDSKLLRFIHTHPWASRLWGALPDETQARLIARFHLRKPFVGPVVWTDESRDLTIDWLRDDVAHLLRHCGKPADFWPEFDVRQGRAAA